MGSTPKGIPYPEGTDAPLGPAQMQLLANAVDKRLPTYQPAAPAAPVVHQTWIDPDGKEWVWDGAAWQPVGVRGFLARYTNPETITWGTDLATPVSVPISVPRPRLFEAVLSLTGSTSIAPVSGILQVTLVTPAGQGRAVFDVNTPVNAWVVGSCMVAGTLPSGDSAVSVSGAAPASIFGVTAGDLRLTVKDMGPA